MVDHAILWRNLNVPGHDAASLLRCGEGWRIEGTAVFVDDGLPCRLTYAVESNSAWRTRTARVCGLRGTREVDVRIAVLAGRWYLNGVEQTSVAGCIDVDLSFTPATNTLPIRRLNLAVGSEAPVCAAWLKFPALALEPLEQTYRRTGEEIYSYESGGGSFTAELAVDEAGFVRNYAGLWTAEA